MSNDLIGKKFDRLTALREHSKTRSGTKWLCVCECGNETVVTRSKLTTGHTKSCGCITKTLKGLSSHKIYKTWWGIKERCHKEYCPNYENYGARGISMSKEWEDFNVFFSWAMDNGYSEDLSIDRIDNDGDYVAENCQWITLSENVAKANKNIHRHRTDFTYYAISPYNVEYEFTNASLFAKEHNLNANGLRRAARGEREHYKGWKFGYTNNKNV